MSMLNAVFAIFKKELRIALRYPSWFIPLFLWPIGFPFGYIFTAKAMSGIRGTSLWQFQSIAGTTDYTTYMLIGTTIWMVVNSMLWSFGNSLRIEQVRGTLESNWLCPIPKVSILLGYALFQLLYTVIYIIISIVEFKIFYGFEFVGSPMLALEIFLISIPSVFGIGFIFSSLVMWAKQISSMVFLVRGIMTIFCGITYPLNVLPKWMKTVSNIIPVTHTVNALRNVIAAGATFSDISYEMRFLAISGIILLALGFISFSFTQHKVKETGSLGYY